MESLLSLALTVSMSLTGVTAFCSWYTKQFVSGFFPQSGAGEYPTMVNENGNQMIPNYKYFWNLDLNFPINQNSECTWIAATIYLQYLQIVQHNGVVPSNYVLNSYESYSNPSSFQESPGTWDGLQSSLPTNVVVDNFYEDFVDDYSSSVYTYPSLAYWPEAFTHYSKQLGLIQTFLSDRGFVELQDYFVCEFYSVLPGDTMYWDIINELQSCRPVLANTPDHSFIIYGYVPNTRQLIIHNGWHSGHSHDVFDWDNLPNGASPGIQYATSISFYSHSHSYPYINGLSGYCFCGDEVYNYPYQHKHQMALYYHNHTHYFYCTICGFIPEDPL